MKTDTTDIEKFLKLLISRHIYICAFIFFIIIEIS